MSKKKSSEWYRYLEGNQKAKQSFTSHHTIQSKKLWNSRTNHHVWRRTLCDKRSRCF